MPTPTNPPKLTQIGSGRASRLLEHKDVQTTMIYIHILNRGGKGVQSPLDSL